MVHSPPSHSITEAQDDIVRAFGALAEDRESMLHYLMELGEKMPPLGSQYKTHQNLIRGCVSSVWLVHQWVDGRIFFQADSNTAITKGLISLLLRILSGQKASDILTAQLYFVESMQLSQLLGAQRSSGLASMIQKLKQIAALEGASISLS